MRIKITDNLTSQENKDVEKLYLKDQNEIYQDPDWNKSQNNKFL